jgi:hypothetical protein
MIYCALCLQPKNLSIIRGGQWYLGIWYCGFCIKGVLYGKMPFPAQEPVEENFVSEYELNSYDIFEEQEYHTMARLTSELQDAGVATTIPNGIYNAHVCEVRDTDRNDVNKILTSQAGAPMVQLDWEVEEGDYTGRKIKFDTIMLGGMSKEGKPIQLSNLCNFLHRTGVPWTCEDCHNPEIGRRFYIAEGSEDDKAHGLKKGNFYCPDCKSVGTGDGPRITYETKTFMGARCGIGVGTKPGTDGREFNIIKGYTDSK